MDLQPKLVVAGRFRLEHELGRGGMGSVWRAQHITLDMPCAVKFIHEQEADCEDIRDRFQQEAQSAAKLRSPHVVQMLDFGIWEEHPYIAMELLEGETLGDRLERDKFLSPVDTLAIATDVGRALSNAAALGIVHRDLKPDNIFLVAEGERRLCKVLDFGIAKNNFGLRSSRLTKTGALLGTPHYMSPEQADGTRPVDSRSDLWSLAVVIYLCMTGERPFESQALGNLFCQIMSGRAPAPSSKRDGLPRGFDSWWQQAAARDPDQRFQSASELVAALRVALGDSRDAPTIGPVVHRKPLTTFTHSDTDPVAASGAASQQFVVPSHTLPSVSAGRPSSADSETRTDVPVASDAAESFREVGTFEGHATPSIPELAPARPWWVAPLTAAAAVTAVGVLLMRFESPPIESNSAASQPAIESAASSRTTPAPFESSTTPAPDFASELAATELPMPTQQPAAMPTLTAVPTSTPATIPKARNVAGRRRMPIAKPRPKRTAPAPVVPSSAPVVPAPAPTHLADPGY